jgi:hypothetical protein
MFNDQKFLIVKGAYYVQGFLDDILMLGRYANINTIKVNALRLLNKLALLFHPSKCNLEPVSEIDYLGMRLVVNEQKFMLTAKQL